MSTRESNSFSLKDIGDEVRGKKEKASSDPLLQKDNIPLLPLTLPTLPPFTLVPGGVNEENTSPLNKALGRHNQLEFPLNRRCSPKATCSGSSGASG